MISSYGGTQGVREKNLLISALAQTSACFQGEYLHKTLFEKGAAYLFHVTSNHPFVDGNKRTGIMVTLLFLALHGIEIKCEEDQLYSMVIQVAEGKSSKEVIASWLEKHS